MANEVFSISTAVVQNGKLTKGTLTLYLDRFEFNGTEHQINWENADCKRGYSTVKSFLFKSEKPHVVISEGQTSSLPFILESHQVDLLLSKISKFRDIVCENRIAEEERIRKEEERKRLEEEERKRREEEERKRREEEERKRREEEERRRREEEERKRREEEERKRREEEERKRREEEERRRKEALAKKVAERKARIEQEVIDAKNIVNGVFVAQAADSAVKKAWAYFTDNPYRILGVSVAATTEEANSSLDKIKKLARLNAVASFKSAYDLSGLEKPVRDLSIVQNALSIVKDTKYKWFWFADPAACIAWQSESYRKELTVDGVEFGSYDLFLANYVYALIFDPQFTNAKLWKPIFRFYKHICTENSHALIKSRFNEKEQGELRIRTVLQAFKAEIFKPLEALCETEDAHRIIRLYKLLKENSDENLNALTKSIMTRLTKWFTSKEEVVCGLVSKCNEDREINAAEAREIKSVGDAYLKEVDTVLEDALSAVKNENVRYEMIKESYRHATWQMMFGLHKAGEKDMAIAYANKCYPYCNEGDKQKIRNTFGFSAIKGADRDATHAEWDIMGDNYYEGKNGYDQDYYEAFKWYEKAAEAGNRYSQNSLGICYQQGNGTYQSDYQAASWFEKAYKNGNPDGAYNLAVCYSTGKGRTQNKQRAVELYLEAAKMGHPQAADAGKALLELMQLELKIHRLTQHEHYDLGYQIPIGETILVEVTLNFSANVYLMEDDEYDKYKECENFSYYGGRATQSPYRLKIPHSGFWHLVIDNGEDDMTGIITSVHTRTLRF